MTAPYALCVTLNPVLDTSYFVNAMRPVYRTEAHRVTHVAGGKGNNAARALVTLGRPAHSLVALGGMVGRMIAEVMAADAYDSTPGWVEGESRLQITVIDAAGKQRAFYAPSAPFSPAGAAAFSDRFAVLLPGAAAVCLCGSSPGGEADPLFGDFVRMARAAAIPVLLDSSGVSLARGLEELPDIVKVNRAEAAGWLGHALTGRGAELAGLRQLKRRVSRWAILTLGEQGALFAAGDRIWHAAPPAVPALNPIGSGDAMTAGLVAALLDGRAPEDCFRAGMAAAAANTLTWDACRFDAVIVPRLAEQILLTEL